VQDKLSAVVVALTLEGVLPGLGRVRRPVPVVRYDRILEERARASLRGIARHLTRNDPADVTGATADCRHLETWSAALATGARTVFFTTG
jgi:hypothetical protein